MHVQVKISQSWLTSANLLPGVREMWSKATEQALYIPLSNAAEACALYDLIVISLLQRETSVATQHQTVRHYWHSGNFNSSGFGTKEVVT